LVLVLVFCYPSFGATQNPSTLPPSSQVSFAGGKMMHMTFYWSRSVTLLFDSWKTNTWLGYVLTLLVCFLFSVFYQYMEDRRIRLQLSSINKSQSPIEVPLLNSKFSCSARWSPLKFLGALIFGVNAAIGYLLMLAIMSFNGGVFVAVVIGLAVGYLLFRSGDGVDPVVVVDNSCACA
jgi:copper transporter 1